MIERLDYDSEYLPVALPVTYPIDGYIPPRPRLDINKFWRRI